MLMVMNTAEVKQQSTIVMQYKEPLFIYEKERKKAEKNDWRYSGAAAY